MKSLKTLLSVIDFLKQIYWEEEIFLFESYQNVGFKSEIASAGPRVQTPLPKKKKKEVMQWKNCWWTLQLIKPKIKTI
jgi:hypothetical protein